MALSVRSARSSIRPAGGRSKGVLVDARQEMSGDYGYDLVHEATGRGKASEARAGGGHGDPPPADGPPDQGQDLGYDEAHDL